MNEHSLTICAWGQADSDVSSWNYWIETCRIIHKKFNSEITHIGIQGRGFSGKVVQYSRVRKKMEEALLSDDGSLQTFSTFSLPKEFKTATFDYECSCVRTKKFCSVTVQRNLVDILRSNSKYIYGLLGQNIGSISRGELFLTSRKEFPLMYAMDPSTNSVKSLEIIEKLV